MRASVVLVLGLAVCAAYASIDDVLARLTPEQKKMVLSLVETMTVEEKVGQMTEGARDHVSNDDVTNYYLGSVLNGGGSVPGSGTPSEFADMYDAYQNAALRTRLRIPIIYGQDAVHGVNNLRGATIFPHNIGLGATRDAQLMRRIGRAVADELLACGCTWTYTPCVAVTRDERWGRTYESMGEDPSVVAPLAVEMLAGVQENGLVQGCVKHFAGDGGAVWGTGDNGYKIDRGNCICNETELRRIHMPAYAKTVADAATVMTSYSSWNGLKMHAHKYLVTDVLKNELKFPGFVISDWDAIYEIPGSFEDQILTSLDAGVDMFMMSSSWRDFFNTLVNLVRNGRASSSRIDDAVTRILAIKARFGLFDHPLADRSYLSHFGTHGDIAREAVQKSLVLLQNKKSALPLSKTDSVFVTGLGANNMGIQCGGWTITWQGSSGPITKGTTIFEGIRSAVEAKGGRATYSDSGSGAWGNNAVVVVLGEQPYAEGVGDRDSLSYDSNDLAPFWNAVNSVDASAKVILVVVSGRTRILTQDVLSRADAVVMAFLPGSEGAGVADVLFGDAPFTGKLPVTWPRDTWQEPINVGDDVYDPLFPFGFGLSY